MRVTHLHWLTQWQRGSEARGGAVPLVTRFHDNESTLYPEKALRQRVLRCVSPTRAAGQWLGRAMGRGGEEGEQRGCQLCARGCERLAGARLSVLLLTRSPQPSHARGSTESHHLLERAIHLHVL